MADLKVAVVVGAKDQASSKFAEIGKKAALALAGIGIAAAGVAVKSTMMAAEFEKGMAEVATLSADVQKNLPALSKGVLNLSAALGQDATASTKALYQAISAGVPAENALKFLEVASKAAIGGVTDTETAVDGLSTVLNAFKLPADEVGRVADVMFTAVKGGKTTFEELSKSMFNVAPLAASLGVSIEEVAASTATLTKSGTPTSVAMTQMRAAMTGLVRPSADMTKLMNKAGFESGQAAIKALGLQGALNLVAEATDGDVGAMSKLLGSVEAVSATLGITGENAKVFQGDMDAMTNSAGASEAAFGTMAATMDQQMKVAKESLNRVFILIGQQLLPILTPLVTAFAEWLPVAFAAAQQKLEELKPHFDTAVAVMRRIADIVIPLLTGAFRIISEEVLPRVMQAFRFLRENFDVVGPAIAAVALAVIVPAMVAWAGAATAAAAATIAAAAATIIALAPVLVPLALIGLAVGALALAWRENFLDIQGKAQAAVEFITGVFTAFSTFIGETWDGIVGTVKDAVNTIIGFINEMIGAWNGISFRVPQITLPSIDVPGLGRVGGGSFGGEHFSVPQLPRIPLLDTGGLVEGPGLFAVGRGVREIVREPIGAPTIVVNVFADVIDAQAVDRLARRIGDQIVGRARLQGASF